MERKTHLMIYSFVVLAIIFLGSYEYIKDNPPSKILALNIPFDLAKTETQQAPTQIEQQQTCDDGIPDFVLKKSESAKKDSDLTVPKLEKKKDKAKPVKKPAPKWYQIFSEHDSTTNIIVVRRMRKELFKMILSCFTNGFVTEKHKDFEISCSGECCTLSYFINDVGKKIRYKAAFDYCGQNVDNIRVFSSKESDLTYSDLDYLALSVVLTYPTCKSNRGGGIDD
ncbi:MAG: hypothetical protein WC663_00015 [Patescibacteria group bacterium]|jgi:hypothetical protein